MPYEAKDLKRERIEQIRHLATEQKVDGMLVQEWEIVALCDRALAAPLPECGTPVQSPNSAAAIPLSSVSTSGTTKLLQAVRYELERMAMGAPKDQGRIVRLIERIAEEPSIALSARQERCKHGVWIADHCWACNPGKQDTPLPDFDSLASPDTTGADK